MKINLLITLVFALILLFIIGEPWRFNLMTRPSPTLLRTPSVAFVKFFCEQKAHVSTTVQTKRIRSNTSVKSHVSEPQIHQLIVVGALENTQR